MQVSLVPWRGIDRHLARLIRGSLSSEEEPCYSVAKSPSHYVKPSKHLPIALPLLVVCPRDSPAHRRSLLER